MDDLRQSRQGRVVQAVLEEYRFKRTPSIDMAELGAIDVEGHGARLHCDPSHILRLDIEKLGVVIDETPDQPLACDPVYLRVPSCDKLHRLSCSRGFLRDRVPSGAPRRPRSTAPRRARPGR